MTSGGIKFTNFSECPPPGASVEPPLQFIHDRHCECHWHHDIWQYCTSALSNVYHHRNAGVTGPAVQTCNYSIHRPSGHYWHPRHRESLDPRKRGSVAEWSAVGPGFKSQPRRCRVTVLSKLFTPIVHLFTKQ